MEDTVYARNVKEAVSLPQGSYILILFNNCYSGESHFIQLFLGDFFCLV